MSSSGVRRAALTLHSLPEADRQWLMTQLPESDCVQIAELLSELERLGVPADIDLGVDLLAELTPSFDLIHVPAAKTARPPEEVLPQLESVKGVLDGEPPGVVALVLSGADEAWRNGYLYGIDPSRRQQIEQHELFVSPPRKLYLATLKAIREVSSEVEHG